jgi:Dual specificity phosphatase, catalytic domain
MTVDEEDAAADSRGDNAEHAWSADLHWLTDRVAVGGCFPGNRSADLARVHGIRAVVDLRAEARNDEAALDRAGIQSLRLATTDMDSPTREQLETGVAFVRKHVAEGRKVLIHCQHGIGRSALLALCVLVDEGWQPLDALTHAKDRREVVSLSRSQFDGWCDWLAARGIAAPDYHTFGCIAYRHLPRG